MLGARKAAVTTPSLRSTVNLDNPASYADPGAAPNGADYVAAARAGGAHCSGKDLESLTFDGRDDAAAAAAEVDGRSTTPRTAPGNPMLWSGNANNLDASAVTPVTVPATARR